MDLQAIKGFKDLLTPETPQWREIEGAARSIFEAHGYREIRLPILEYTELFARSIGEATDIVEKEMFTFEDRGGNSITLRPEGTAGAVRSYIEHGLYKSSPKSRLYYIGPMFRRERPQKGRLRQFHQIGAEAFGIAGALADAELIAIQDMLFKKLGVNDLDLAVNSLGCKKCRPPYRDKLVKFLAAIPPDALCKDCQRRRETNPMRVLDCKNEGCRKAVEEAPTIFADLCEECKSHHKDLEKYLDGFGVKFRVEPRLVRGLDYYTRTAFEFLSSRLGAQSAVSAGGRYDDLVEQLGGPPTPGVGFAIGIERLAMLIADKPEEAKPDVFFALIGEEAMQSPLLLAYDLRKHGIGIEMEYEPRGLKGQMKQANKSGAKYSFIVGPSEIGLDENIKEPKVVLQDMVTKEKHEKSVTEAFKFIYDLVNKTGKEVEKPAMVEFSCRFGPFDQRLQQASEQTLDQEITFDFYLVPIEHKGKSDEKVHTFRKSIRVRISLWAKMYFMRTLSNEEIKKLLYWYAKRELESGKPSPWILVEATDSIPDIDKISWPPSEDPFTIMLSEEYF